MKKINLILICSLAFLFYSCEKAVDEPVTELPAIYQGCCGTKPVEFTYGLSKVYIPNVFTPNGDGLNDYFYPTISDDIVDVQDFTILSAVGDTVLFERPSFNNYIDIPNYAWKGERYNKNGTYKSDYQGLFKYNMRIANKSGQSQYLEGEACVIRCGKETKVFKTKEGCFYPDQADAVDNKGLGKGNGLLSKVKKTQESTCF
jgi:CHU_C Type IX secretion signal domain